jgi:hypothetical protein
LAESDRHDTIAALFADVFNTTPAKIETEWQSYVHDLMEGDD